jgi:hypothetical protein
MVSSLKSGFELQNCGAKVLKVEDRLAQGVVAPLEIAGQLDAALC